MERKINVWLPLMLHFLGSWPETQACALTGNQTGDPLVCRPVLNPLNHTSQGEKILHRSIKNVKCILKGIKHCQVFKLGPENR